ncbi:MAG TPA: DUF983 domain-containing protein [Stellaceae bacterium]|nr:DUF983 domain-containing protein [Stellaceae bacterium]
MVQTYSDIRPSVATAVWRGFRRRCPRCGRGALFSSLLTLNSTCPSCDEPLGEIRADDMPAYVTIFVTGHVVVPMILWIDHYDPPAWVEFAVAVPVSLALIGLLLPRIKGAVAALLWSLRLKGTET